MAVGIRRRGRLAAAAVTCCALGLGPQGAEAFSHFRDAAAAGRTTSARARNVVEDCRSGGRLSPPPPPALSGWVQDDGGEWNWEEDDPAFAAAAAAREAEAASAAAAPAAGTSQATPTLPAGSFKPKQSLGQNFLKDGNTVSKIVRSYVTDARETIKLRSDGTSMIEGERPGLRAVELGPGAGALTDRLVDVLGTDSLQCIEIDERSVELLGEKHPGLRVRHEDVLQADYPALADDEGGPLSIIGNLPYYITSQILFALADASHSGAVRSATVTMQWEVAQRIVAATRTKDYGILSVVFQLYADCTVHFKIPPTVFYPQPKVDSALVGLRFIGPDALRRRLGGVHPTDIRRVLTSTFQQRRKTVRNGLKKLAIEVCEGDKERAKALLDSIPSSPISAEASKATEPVLDELGGAWLSALPDNWASKRPEELSAGQFVELTRLLFGPHDRVTKETSRPQLGKKVWRKLKHGSG